MMTHKTDPAFQIGEAATVTVEKTQGHRVCRSSAEKYRANQLHTADMPTTIVSPYFVQKSPTNYATMATHIQ